MTRLVKEDITNLKDKLNNYNALLIKLCGHSLGEVAKIASGKSKFAQNPKIAVIPVTSGLGVISGFCQTVADIIGFLGYDADVLTQTDIAGIAYTIKENYDVFFTADDSTFVAVNTGRQIVSDNSEATGRGFATALNLVSGEGKKVLLLGAGPVGVSAARVLSANGAGITLFDIDKSKYAHFLADFPRANVADSLEDALNNHDFVYDATPTGAFIKKEMLKRSTIIVAPGVPRCVDEECNDYLQGRIIHDVLELGVATMLFDVL